MKRDNKRKKRRQCNFCADKIEVINYKDIGRLRRHITERGKLLPRRVTGNCALHQRQLTLAVKRARIMALLPYTSD